MTGGVAARPLVMDAADLALELVECLVDGHDLVGRALFGAEDVAAGADRDLGGRRVGTDPVVQGTQLELGVDDSIDQAVEPVARRSTNSRRPSLILTPLPRT